MSPSVVKPGTRQEGQKVTGWQAHHWQKDPVGRGTSWPSCTFGPLDFTHFVIFFYKYSGDFFFFLL